MTTEQKVALVESVQNAYGLNFALSTVGLPKATWYYHQKQKVAYEEKHAHLRPVLEKIAREHPEYGVPRIMPELREESNLTVNHKVVERLLGGWDLSFCAALVVPGRAASKKLSPRVANEPIWWLR